MTRKSTLHSLDLQNWSLLIWCSVVLHPGHLYFGSVSYFCRCYSLHILGIYSVPHKYQNVAQGLFYVGARNRAIIQTYPTAPKMPKAPSASPHQKKGVGIRHQAINLALPKQGRAWGDGSLRPKESWSQPRYTNAEFPQHLHLVALIDCHQSQDTTNLYCVPGIVTSQNVSWRSVPEVNTDLIF